MTELTIETKEEVGNGLLGYKYVIISGEQIQHVIDFMFLKCILRVDISENSTTFLLSIYKLYIRFGFGIA
tara:strand:- start:611 stop:820 length:210 start_codon:yes stop_codon:yes gene_type:complete